MCRLLREGRPVIPCVVVALLAGFAAGGLLRRTETMAARRRARTWQQEALVYAHQARKAWAYADNEERVAHELRAELDVMFDRGYDTGFADAAGIDVEGLA